MSVTVHHYELRRGACGRACWRWLLVPSCIAMDFLVSALGCALSSCAFVRCHMLQWDVLDAGSARVLTLVYGPASLALRALRVCRCSCGPAFCLPGAV